MIKKQETNQPILSKKKNGGIILEVLVQPRASRDEIIGPHDRFLKVRLTAPPVEGAANKTLLRLLSKRIKIPVRNLTIKKGHKSRQKTIVIEGGDFEKIRSRLKLQ